MISLLENKTVCFTPTSASPSLFSTFLEYLKSNEQLDGIIDLSKVQPEKALPLVEDLYTYQQENDRLLLVVISNQNRSIFPEKWELVPTQTEAIDFISFEQMQRDLGF